MRSRQREYIFDLYANHGCTIDMVAARLNSDGRTYTAKQPHWVRSKIHRILRDRSYIGDLKWHGHWQPGKHVPIVDRQTFQRASRRFSARKCTSLTQILYAAELIFCGHCGRPITGEIVKKKSGKEYVYYRLARYTPPDIRIRLREEEIDSQVLRLIRQTATARAGARVVPRYADLHLRLITKSKPAHGAWTFSVNSTRLAGSRSGC